MTGFVSLLKSKRSTSETVISISICVLPCISLMSAPAAKALSLPVKIIAPMLGSLLKASMASFTSSISAELKAFSACGRLSRTRPTPSAG